MIQRLSDGHDVSVQFQSLRKEFPRRGQSPFVAVDDLSLDVPTGTVFGLLGPNGSGKTTSVNMLCGLLQPTAGTVFCEGVDVRRDVTGVRALLGVVPQETSLYNDLTAQENLLFHARLYRVPKAEQRPRIDEVLELVGLTARRHDRVGAFSGGMQRRLALARALITQPRVVALDEPTLGVDVQSRNAVWERIRAIVDEGRTVLLTTNYMEEAQALADHLAIIDHGKLVVTGTPDEMRSRLGRTKVEVATDGEQEWATLDQLGSVTKVEGHGRHLIRVEFTDDENPAQTLLDWASQRGLRAHLMAIRQPDLNDVFLSLTGKELRDGKA